LILFLFSSICALCGPSNHVASFVLFYLWFSALESRRVDTVVPFVLFEKRRNDGFAGAPASGTIAGSSSLQCSASSKSTQ
jgi:hypothetical protein